MWNQLTPVPRIQEAPPSRPAYFWWFLLNILALCFAVTSWVVCLHVFGNPEIPRNYKILKRLGQEPEIKRYTALDTPNGSSLDVRGLYARFRGLDGENRRVLNSMLLRNYMTNFGDLRSLTYVEGEFRVEDVRLLDAKDFIPQGFAVRARAMVKPDEHSKHAAYPVVVDFLFPTAKTDARAGFQRGAMLDIRRGPHGVVVLRVDLLENEDDTLVNLTVVPIVYGPYQVGGGLQIELDPPSGLVPGAAFPVFGK